MKREEKKWRREEGRGGKRITERERETERKRKEKIGSEKGREGSGEGGLE